LKQAPNVKGLIFEVECDYGTGLWTVTDVRPQIEARKSMLSALNRLRARRSFPNNVGNYHGKRMAKPEVQPLAPRERFARLCAHFPLLPNELPKSTTCNMNDPATIIEQRDAVEHLVAHGFQPLLDALQEPSCYTRRGSGRLVISEVARRLEVSPRRAKVMLQEARAAVEQ
jgi:hypothetical protein